MKTHRFDLARWLPVESLPDSDDIVIDWPAVHRQAGVDRIQWLKNRDPAQCQMVVERRPNDQYMHLIAEIYTDKLATLYTLMWAK